MAKYKSIPDTMRKDIADWEEQAYTVQTIQKLLSDRDIHVSIPTVYRYTREIRLQRQEAAKATFALEVQKTATKDLRTMANVIEKLELAFDRAISKNNVELSLKISNELNKWNGRRMELSGISKDTAQLIDTNPNSYQEDYIDAITKAKKEDN